MQPGRALGDDGRNQPARFLSLGPTPVSYTHLEVHRQVLTVCLYTLAASGQNKKELSADGGEQIEGIF